MMSPVIVVWCVSGITGPSIQSLLSHQYPSNEQGGVQGALTSLSSLTGIVGPLIGTWVFGYFTSAAAPIALPGAPFFLGAAFIVASAFVATVAMRRHKAAAA
jgi:DHA1 family tetracycline resistance protein-like MFS transporter